MNKREREEWNHTVRALESFGLTYDECETLRRCGMTLRRWAERECNGEVQRDEVTGKPFVHSTYDGRKLYATADREAGAIRRAKSILQAHGLELYHQGDPRGASIYAIRPGDVPNGKDVGAYYTRGICVA